MYFSAKLGRRLIFLVLWSVYADGACRVLAVNETTEMAKGCMISSAPITKGVDAWKKHFRIYRDTLGHSSITVGSYHWKRIAKMCFGFTGI